MRFIPDFKPTLTYTLCPHEVLHSCEGNRVLTNNPIPNYIITVAMNALKVKGRALHRVVVWDGV